MMYAALTMEWGKLRTLRATAWWLAALVGLSVALGAFSAGSASPQQCAPRCAFDLPRMATSGVYLGQVAVIALAALAVTSEYDTKMIRITLAACPRRARVLAAKLTVVTAVAAAGAAVAMAGSLLAGRVILTAGGFTAAHGYPPLSLADPPTARAFAGSVAYLALIALLAAGACAVIRHTGGSVAAVIALLFLPVIAGEFITDPQWQHRIAEYAPMPAGLAIQVTRNTGALPASPWHGLAVLAAWAAAAVVAGLVMIRRRDA